MKLHGSCGQLYNETAAFNVYLLPERYQNSCLQVFGRKKLKKSWTKHAAKHLWAVNNVLRDVNVATFQPLTFHCAGTVVETCWDHLTLVLVMKPQLDIPGQLWPEHTTHDEAYGNVTHVAQVTHTSHIISYHIISWTIFDIYIYLYNYIVTYIIIYIYIPNSPNLTLAALAHFSGLTV